MSAEGSKCELRGHLLLEEVNYTDADALPGSVTADGTQELSGVLVGHKNAALFSKRNRKSRKRRPRF